MKKHLSLHNPNHIVILWLTALTVVMAFFLMLFGQQIKELQNKASIFEIPEIQLQNLDLNVKEILKEEPDFFKEEPDFFKEEPDFFQK